jgi:short-subunit dehydrogenase involved in D-alanine esterification of teichoic acids
MSKGLELFQNMVVRTLEDLKEVNEDPDMETEIQRVKDSDSYKEIENVLWDIYDDEDIVIGFYQETLDSI